MLNMGNCLDGTLFINDGNLPLGSFFKREFSKSKYSYVSLELLSPVVDISHSQDRPRDVGVEI